MNAINTGPVKVTVKSFNISRGYGFFAQEGKKNPDVFVHIEQLLGFGFEQKDMQMNRTAFVDFEETRKGLIVTKVYSIGDKKALPTERRLIIDRNGDLIIIKVTEIATGCNWFEIRKGSIDGEQVGDRIFFLADARKAIGKVINHPIPINAGTKTNVIRPRPDGKQKERKQKQAA